MTKRKPKDKTIRLKPGGNALLFTSAGTLRSGQELKLPGPEASRLLAKGIVVEVIKRRKKSGIDKDVDSGDGGGTEDPGREPDPAESLPTSET